MNTLYYGDDLQVMREHIADESVDLVYLDPPFNSSRDYNVLFKQAKRDENQAQITAFSDTWQWSLKRYQEFFEDSHNQRLFELVQALHTILGNSEMMAYLVMMAPRLLELHRVLKPTGSLYLHCDPTASHYLKLLLDVVFGQVHFRNEIVWQRTNARSTRGTWPRVHDVLLHYGREPHPTFHPASVAADLRRMPHHLITGPDGLKYQTYELTAPGRTRDGESGKPWRGFDPGKYDRHWANVHQQMDDWDAQGLIHWPAKDGFPRRLAETPFDPASRTVTVGDVWTDVDRINQTAKERMGYPTQKPLALLERIIAASSDPGDLVFDPFRGCGTATVAAEKLGRRWIGIDITFIAIDLIITRLASDFALVRGKDYLVKGDPKDAYSARKLFEESPKQFEIWAVGLVAGIPQPEKSGDKGIDGKVYFQDLAGELQYAVCQVKGGGNVSPHMIRDFAHVIEREKAAMGFFISLETPTKGAYDEAETLGFFTSPSGRLIPKLQIRTIEELLVGKEFDFPEGYRLRSGTGKRLTRDTDQTAMEMEE